jgi:hypothetical protein
MITLSVITLSSLFTFVEDGSGIEGEIGGVDFNVLGLDSD